MVLKKIDAAEAYPFRMQTTSAVEFQSWQRFTKIDRMLNFIKFSKNEWLSAGPTTDQ